MNRTVYFIIIFSFLFIINSCGVSRQEYEKVKTERDQLLEELDLYKNGEPRLVALIEQDISNGNFLSARRNLNILNDYHPESMVKPEIAKLVTSITNEEERVARVTAEREAAERAARLERQKGFENTQAANAAVLTVAEADLLESNKRLTAGNYYIVSGYFDGERGGRIRIGETCKRYSDGTYLVSGASISVNSDHLLNLAVGMPITVLVRAFDGHLVINPDSKVQGFSFVELKRQ